MADESDPPRKFYQLKPREFEVVNHHPPASPPSASIPPTIQPTARIDVHDLYRQAGTPGPVLGPVQKDAAKNEVHVILHDNLTRANTAGLNDLAPRPRRRSRRKRDFFIILIPLQAFFVFVAFGPYSNVATMAYGVAGIILSTIGLTWVMFFVMDDY
jgi:hypothetical protein